MSEQITTSSISEDGTSINSLMSSGAGLTYE